MRERDRHRSVAFVFVGLDLGLLLVVSAPASGSQRGAAPRPTTEDGGAGVSPAPRRTSDLPLLADTGGDERKDKTRTSLSWPEEAIGGTSVCPSAAATWLQLETLIPRDRLAARLDAVGGGHAAAPIQFFDLGRSYRVIAAGRVREYEDGTRDCLKRASVAAVFVALAIDPLPIGPRPPSAPPSPVAPPSPAGTDTRAPLVRLDLGAVLDAGTGSGSVIAQAGAALRVAAGRNRLAFSAGVLLLAPADTATGGVALRQWRLPADVGARLHLGGLRVRGYADLGIAVALLSEQGRDLATDRTRRSLEVGGRAAIEMQWGTPSSRFAPFAGLQAEVVPRPSAVYALPQGVAGHTPVVWLGIAAGVSVDFLR